MIRAVRGAIQIDVDKDFEIAERTHQLVTEILKKNTITLQNVVSIQFTQTIDLVSLNCAAGLRRFGFGEVPLFCAQEPNCDYTMPRIIRVLVTFNSDKNQEVKHIYLNGAENLRPDIARQ